MLNYRHNKLLWKVDAIYLHLIVLEDDGAALSCTLSDMFSECRRNVHVNQNTMSRMTSYFLARILMAYLVTFILCGGNSDEDDRIFGIITPKR